MAWQKVSSKLYQIQIDGKYQDINVPFQKSKLIFSAFLAGGGVFGESGEVNTDPIRLMAVMEEAGNILLTEYGPRGSVVTEGDCGVLSKEEVLDLFNVAADIVQDFIEPTYSAEEKVVKEKSAAKTAKKAS